MSDIEIMVTCPRCHRDNHARFVMAYATIYVYCPHCYIVYSTVRAIDLGDTTNAVRRMLYEMQMLGSGDDITWIPSLTHYLYGG